LPEYYKSAMEEGEENTIIENNKPKFWQDSNTMLTFSAIFISLVTLFILIYQTSLASRQFDLEQKQQLASVMPYVQIWTGYSTNDEYTIIVENLGIGPAFIKKVNVHYQDSIYENIDYPNFYYSLRDREEYGDYMGVYSNIFMGSVIPADRQILHIKILKGDRPNIWDDLFISDEIELEIEYASIYDERWVVRGLFNEPVKTKGIAD